MTVPQADHRLAWSYLSAMLAISGLVALVCTRRSWRNAAASDAIS
jgi:hypothetical protein